MKKTFMFLITALIFLIGLLIYKKDLIIEFFQKPALVESTTNNNLEKDNENLQPNPVSDDPMALDDNINLTEEEKINQGLEYFYQNEGLFDGENFDERRYYFSSNFITNTDKSIENYFLSTYANNLRNQPKKIVDAFEKYNNLFYNLISKRAYRVSNIDKIIEGLIISYDDLITDDNPYENMQEIYKIMKFQSGYDADAKEFYPKIEPYIAIESLTNIEKIRLSSGKQFSDGDVVWFYSFWARRNKEGNINQVFEVISSIKEHYNEGN
jgi:hypothetical protein